MAEEIVSLVVAGQSWSQWERINVSYSAKKGARAFAATIIDPNDNFNQWSFMPGTEFSVYAGNDLCVQGYINKMEPSYDATNHKVEISGRSKSQDAIDSSAEHQTGEWRNKDLLSIAKDLDAQNVGFTSSTQLDKIPLFRVHIDETVFSAVERGARKQGLLLMGKPNGGVDIAKGGTTRIHPAFVEGQNIYAGSASFDDSDKHSKIKVRGQRPFGSSSKDSLRIEGIATDSTVSRNRPKLIHAEGDVDSQAALKRATWHRDRKQGESVSAKIKAQGWHDDNGMLWTPNTLVYISSPMLKLSMDLLLSDVALTQDASGSWADLTFVHPKALGSTASSGSGTQSEWAYNPQDS